MKGAKGDPNASFFVQLRRHERQLMRDALVYADWDEDAAAKLLGLEVTYLRTRGRRIGGVFQGDADKEPYQWESNPPGKKLKPKKKPRNEKPANELPTSGPVADDQGDSTDDASGGSGGPDLDQGGDAGDDDQSRNGEHLQPD
jgi:hypothetical protein